MNPKARITYRFDNNNGARKEGRPEAAEHRAQSNVVSFFQEEMKFTSDIGVWNSPFQDDARALENLIRATDGEQDSPGKPAGSRDTADATITHKRAGASESYNEAVDWSNVIPLGDEISNPSPILPRTGSVPVEEENGLLQTEAVREQEERPIARSAFATATSYRPGRGPSWYKVLASVVGAVATGALFGYMLLALFTVDQGGSNDTAEIAPVTDKQDSTDGGQSNGDLSGKPAGQPGSTAANAVAVNIPSKTYYMLQYGLFSSKEGLDEAVAGLAGKGLAAAPLASEDGYRVFAGVAGERSDALMLDHTLGDLELYVKQVDLPAVSSFSFAGQASAVENFFRQTGGLIGKLEKLTVAGLVQSAGEQDDWRETHQSWTEVSSLMESGVVDAAGKTWLHKLQQAINTAAVAAGEYEKKNSAAHLWSIQTALMEAIFVQKEWFASMDAL